MKRYDSYKDSGVEWIGEVPSHWEINRIKYLGQIVAGSTPNTNTKEFWDGDINWITPADMKQKYLSSGNRSITEAGLAAIGYKTCPKGSVIMSTRAPVGTLGIAISALTTNQGCKAIVPKENNSNFIYYMLISNVDVLKSKSNTTTFDELGLSTLANHEFACPPLAEQTAIATYLDNKCAKIDNVIATQEKRVELLRELKQSIITRAVTRGINPDVKMKDSGVEWVGEIPEHWEVVQLKHVLQGMQDGTHGTYTRIDSPYYLLSAKNVFEDGLRISDTESAISEKDYNAIVSNGYPAKGDVAICCVGTIGRCCIYNEDTIYAFQRSVTFLRCKQSIGNKFLLYSLRSKISVEQILQLAKTSAQSGIYMGALATIKLLLPPLSEQHQIVTYIEQQTSKLDRSITKALRQIELLKEYKQSLITEVVTGKRKVC